MARLVRYFLFSLSLILVAVSVAGLVLYKTGGLKLYSVQSGSMAPSILPGDLALDTKPRINSLRPGDVISYVSANGSGEVITHRLVKIEVAKGYALTQGDSLAQTDPPVPLNTIIGKNIKTIPVAGYILDDLHQPLFLVGFIYIPALIIASIEVKRLGYRFGRRAYQVDS